ncbi:unnamed protein product [Blepharisma stoltei]|uniref:Uncharacterized protein n=1 Tax=Blepharisma stoltei TaxID=1481888 RepID=A0AAU9IJR6_9CILI|nr:unnamed protein product [Blepharisma stoltei]
MEYEKTIEALFHSKLLIVEIKLSSSQLNISVQEKLSEKSWIGEFSPSFIEELTLKTGNFKKFSIFTKMLISGLEGTSSAVVVDILNHEDLDQLRNTSSYHSSSKLYFIITYVGEFDKVHYPLPLNTQTVLDSSSLQKTISRLKKEVDILKTSMEPHQMEISKTLKENSFLKAQIEELRAELEILGNENKEKGEIIRELEKAKAESLKENKTLQKENDGMVHELDKIRGHMDMIIEQLEEAEREKNKWGSTKSLLQEIEEQKKLIERLNEEIEMNRSEIKELKLVSKKDKSRILQLESELRALFDRYRCEPPPKPMKRSTSVKPESMRKSADSFSKLRTSEDSRKSFQSSISPNKSEKHIHNTSYDSDEIQRRLTKIQNMMKIVKE